jgi:hypothetical protein
MATKRFWGTPDMNTFIALAAATLTLVAGSLHAGDTVIAFRLEDSGRTLEGLGAVSAGASSRLLIDYP